MEKRRWVFLNIGAWDFVMHLYQTFTIWVFPKIWENPQIIHLFIGVGTIIFTIHFGGKIPLFLETSISFMRLWLGHQDLELRLSIGKICFARSGRWLRFPFCGRWLSPWTRLERYVTDQLNPIDTDYSRIFLLLVSFFSNVQDDTQQSLWDTSEKLTSLSSSRVLC